MGQKQYFLVVVIVIKKIGHFYMKYVRKYLKILLVNSDDLLCYTVFQNVPFSCGISEL